ncbi:serine hydrolase [Marilutibacter alkalisoli]|uniref:Beta-lactamase family protein n=1 Tax=Marilutibacter alkalisoli TaxID=2591633 RepID=A0A514BRV3_9GAMM|nr:serine hydrolase [Lysobacter alkalisoli]QDH70122.1 beta-lactamase family protein [Lysobacter alkalisoli]
MKAHVHSPPVQIQAIAQSRSRWRRTYAVFAALATAGLLLASATPASAAEWVARHGLTGTQYQQAFQNYTGKGYRLMSVSGYEQGGGARYAALWSKQAGPAWAARHGLTPQQYQAAFNDYTGKGYRLSYVNGYEVGGKPYYAAIWQKSSGPAWQARHDLTADQYQAAVTSLSGQGYGVSHVSAFSVGGSPRFAAIFEKSMPAWVARHGLTAGGYQQAFNEFTGKGYRLKVVSGYRQGNSDRYAAVWTKTGGPQWSARHGIPATHYQHVFDNYAYQSWEPQYIEAFNSASGVRFNGLWTNTVFKPQDLKLIDDKVRAYMKAKDIPGMSIAIMKDKRLVYAAGFGQADVEAGLPVGPKHRFRIASVSKPITVVATRRLIDDTSLTLNSKVFGSRSVLGGQYATPSDNTQIEDITVDHLIRHRGGFLRIDKNGNGSDPMFAYTGTTHKGLIEWALENYPLGYAPGTDPGLPGDQTYSNFGYSLLGRVIEARSGKSYEAYVRDTILKPAGASGMVIGGDKLADRKPNEVKYYGNGAYSSVKPQRFDSHGGWIATPIDLLRFMRHETVLSNSYAHYGAMAGTKAVYRRRSDGFGYAATSNSGNGGTDEINDLLKEIVEGVSAWPSGNLF